MVHAKVWVLKTIPVGLPQLEDFMCIEEELPPCENGGIIIEAECFSVDPYMRYRIRLIAVNTAIPGSQVARVIESKNAKYPVGTKIVVYPGWRSHTYLSQEQLNSGDLLSSTRLIPDLGNFPVSTALGILGMPGNTAYFGFLEICKPKAGDTVLVNAAAGAVGSAVVQIAKFKGCKVIAFVGSEEKMAWLKELGADHVFNYKTDNISEMLKKAAPEGINCYFDNVGGKFTSEALPHMAEFGRVSICGAISTYNDPDKFIGVISMSSPYAEATILWKQLKVEGFIVSRWLDRWDEGLTQLKQWLEEGKLKYKETVTEGFHNMPKAFLGLFQGDNIGKAIITA